MRFNSVGFALSVGMALIVVLLGLTLLSAAGLVGFAAADTAAPRELLPTKAPADSTGSLVEMPAPAPLTAAQVAEIAAGNALFKGNCAQCHAVNEVVVGPALAGITKRRPVAWLIPWVKNSGRVVASGDEYAGALFTKYQRQQMPSFVLSDPEIKAILCYISSEETPVSSVAAR